MKAKLFLIGILAFLALSISSCFLKPKYHYNDHRGYYPDMGRSKEENTSNRIKYHRHPRELHRHIARERRKNINHRAHRKAESDNSEPKFHTDWKDSTGQKTMNVPADQNTQPVQQTQNNAQPGQVVQPDQKGTDAPADQPVEKERKHHKKHKKRKKEQEETDSGVPADQNVKSDTTGQK